MVWNTQNQLPLSVNRVSKTMTLYIGDGILACELLTALSDIPVQAYCSENDTQAIYWEDDTYTGANTFGFIILFKEIKIRFRKSNFISTTIFWFGKSMYVDMMVLFNKAN